MTRTKPAEQRRAELLAAGRALFLAKGIAATSLDDITQRAGVSKGLFYLYFASKEDLVLALQEQFSGEVAARMAAAAAPLAKAGQADWAARLDACVLAGFECYRELHDLHEVLFHHAHRSGQIRPSPPWSSGTCSRPGWPRARWTCPIPESTAVLCYASMHAFDLRGHGGPDDARLIRAAQQLVRRAAGLTLADGQPWPAHWPSATRRRHVLSRRRSPVKKRAARAFRAARMADHYHSGSEHGIIGRRIETIVASGFHRRRGKAYAVPVRRGGSGRKGMGEWRR